jgi:phosphoglycolate phosphatase-like HAD superfamily hydrolase
MNDPPYGFGNAKPQRDRAHLSASLPTPNMLALDFDGVLCDGLIEYFQVAWRTYEQLWQPDRSMLPEDVAPIFYRLRPVIETGWEMPVLLKALRQGVSETEILQHWVTIAPQILADSHLDAKTIGTALDRQRDEWITTDLDGWLALHRFYPGVIERIQSVLSSSVYPVIISTKEGRFINQLLQKQGIELSAAQIIGKESQRPKHQVLRELAAIDNALSSIWFIEDRLKTLLSIQPYADLAAIRLFLADWGYNTEQEREAAQQNSRIELLSLSNFAQDFSRWPGSLNN